MSVTIKDVAKKADVSITTVSKYLNGGNVLEENRGRIQAAIDALGYSMNLAAHALKTNRSYTIGVLLPEFGSPFYAKILTSFEQTLTSYGYSILLCDYQNDIQLAKEKIQLLAAKQIDGFALALGKGGSELSGELKTINLPTIAFDGVFDDYECDVVMSDNVGGAYAAAAELIAAGHRRIAMITGPDRAFSSIERVRGYYRAHEDYHLAVDEKLMVNGGYTMQGGYAAMEALCRGDAKPDAVFAANYDMTLGAVMAANALHIAIPNDLSLIGYDAFELSQVISPPLTLITQPMVEMGVKAAELLIQRLNGNYNAFPQVQRLKTALLRGASVKDTTKSNI